jgi:hypothetical protein
MTKILLIVFLILGSQVLFAQQILRCNELLTDINLVCEYFSDLDSAFAAKNKVIEIKVTESYYNQGVLKFERTKLNYKYDRQFKKSYSEVNSWHEDGKLIRGDIVIYYKDSIINSQLYRSSYNPNKCDLFTKYVTKLVWLNDTLLKKDSYSFFDDSLYRHEDLGIEDTRAELREYEKMKKIPVDSLTTTIVTENEFIEHLEPDYSIANPHNDILIKDSLGRIIEMENFFVTTLIDQRGSFPKQKFFIEYLDSTNIIKSIKAYEDFYTNKEYFENRIKDGLGYTWNHFWPQNYMHSNLYFEYTASHFKFGIPQHVIISLGNDASTKRIYKTIISTR